MDHHCEQLHGILVTALDIIDDHYPQLVEANLHQLVYKLLQQILLLFLGQRFVLRVYREVHVEGLIENAQKLRLLYSAQMSKQFILALLHGGDDVETQRQREDQLDQIVRNLCQERIGFHSVPASEH